MRSRRERPVPTLLFGLVLTAMLGLPAAAEIGAYVRSPGGSSLYVLQGIIDEPEPIDSFTAWLRYFEDSPNRKVLNEQGFANEDGSPSLLNATTTGFPLAAWARNGPAGYDIVVSRFDGTEWSVPQIVAGSPGDELDPTLALDPTDGSIHLVYWIDDGLQRVVHRQAPADLSSWSPEAPVSQIGHAAVRPSAAFHEGALRVIYEVHDLGQGTTPRQIVLATHDGQGFTYEILATTQHAASNWPGVHTAGDRMWVDWIDADNEVAWTRQATDGSWDPIEVEYFATPEQRDFHVRGLVRHLALQ